MSLDGDVLLGNSDQDDRAAVVQEGTASEGEGLDEDLVHDSGSFQGVWVYYRPSESCAMRVLCQFWCQIGKILYYLYEFFSLQLIEKK